MTSAANLIHGLSGIRFPDLRIDNFDQYQILWIYDFVNSTFNLQLSEFSFEKLFQISILNLMIIIAMCQFGISEVKF
jgi:hypothetical protein